MEEAFIGIFIGLIALVLVLYILYQVFSLFRGFFDLGAALLNRSRENRRVREHFNRDFIQPHLSHHVYFQRLTEEGKERFLQRLTAFLYDKYFVGMDGLILTDEMRIFVSASVAQLTFGLQYYTLPLFHTVRIYPKDFYSRLAEKHMKGGTTPSGIILLSWSDFLKGNADATDKINLGLHEMAHALLLEILHGSEPIGDLESRLIQWERAGKTEMENMRAGRPGFLRAYAASNEHEFFAVAVEHFFEAPEEFKKRLSGIYHEMCGLLNQDPLNTRWDYRFDSRIRH